MNLLEIPTEQFPLNHACYMFLMHELRSVPRGFTLLQQRGWSNGKELDARLVQIRNDLQEVWELVQDTERQLVASLASKR